MQYFQRALPSFSAVGAGQTANISVPTGGYTYAFWLLKYVANGSDADEATFGADITNIKIKLDGEVLIDLSGQDLLDLNNYYGYEMANGYFPIMFVRPEFLDPIEEARFALGTLGLGQVTMEVKIDSGATAPELSMTANILSGQSRGPGQLIRIRKTAYGNQAASGTREIDNLPVTGPETGRGLKALHIGSGNIDSHEVLLNNQTIHEATAEELALTTNIYSFKSGGRNPVSGKYHIDFTGDRYSGIIPTQNADIRAKLEFNSADAAFEIIHEEVIGQRDI